MSCRIISVLVVVFLFLGNFAAQAEEKRSATAIVILPFDAASAGKYAYLKDSLRTMLATRLAARDGIRILEPTLSQKDLQDMQTARKQALPPALFSRLHADYIATGLLSAAADDLNLQLTFYPAASGKKPVKFTMTAEKEEKVLSSLEGLAAEVGNVVSNPSFGLQKTEVGSLDDTSAQQSAAPKTEASELDAFRTAHPERLYKTGIYSKGNIVGVDITGAQGSGRGVRKSQPIAQKLVSMAVGDLDGDGNDEIVLAADGELRIYRYQDGRFAQETKLPLSPKLKIHAVNVADLERTGRKLIYISATEDNMISSQVVEWDKGHGLRTLHKDVRWYLRPLNIPGQGLVLAGQEKGVDESIFVFPGIYELTMKKGSDVPVRGKKLPVPKNVNLFDFAFADLNGDGKIETVAIDRNEKLAVYDQAGVLLWISEDNFGGSKNYLGPSYRTPAMGEDKTYVPTRILVTDLNHDKKQEVIIGRNKRESYTSYFKNLRYYDGGYISCMTWSGTGLSELWHTNTLGGLIADYNLGSSAGEKSSQAGSREGKGHVPAQRPAARPMTLFVGQIPESGISNILIPSDNEAVLFAYEIGFIAEGGKK